MHCDIMQIRNEKKKTMNPKFITTFPKPLGKINHICFDVKYVNKVLLSTSFGSQQMSTVTLLEYRTVGVAWG